MRKPTKDIRPLAADLSAKKKKGRRAWFDLHGWIGLKLSVFMGFVCLTGTLAVFAHEIDWLLLSEIRVTPAPVRASWGQMVVVAQDAYPDWTLQALKAPHASHFAAMALMRTQDGRYRYVWIDPYRGHVTGDTHWFNAHRFLRNTHRHLMIPVKYGVPLVAALSVPLLLSLVSSFFICKRWWRGFFSWPRTGRARRYWGDWHRLLGVWGLWFIALIAVTGTWYLVESLGGRAPVPEKIVLPTTTEPGRVEARALDAAVATLAQRWPELRIQMIHPDHSGQSVLIGGQAQAWLTRDRANVAGFDLRTGDMIDLRDGRDMSMHQRISEMADPLHFGDFGGWPVRLVWFLFGAIMTALSLSGVYLYGLRIAEGFKNARKPAPGTS